MLVRSDNAFRREQSRASSMTCVSLGSDRSTIFPPFCSMSWAISVILRDRQRKSIEAMAAYVVLMSFSCLLFLTFMSFLRAFAGVSR